MKSLYSFIRPTFIHISSHCILISVASLASITQANQTPLEEVIVTAQKRSEKLQNVPISLSAFSGDNLQKAGIDSIKNLDSITPGITFTSSLSSAGEGIRVRGIGSAGFNTGVEQSVSVVIDGVVTGPSGSGLSSLWDVERVEVLRGPQGTLFGKNASAGAVNVTSKRPASEFEANVSAQYEVEYEGTKVDAAVGGPVTQHINVRLAAFSLNQGEGYIENILSNDSTNQKEQWGIRALVDYDSESWNVKLTLSNNQSNHECCTRTFREIDQDSANLFTRLILIPTLTQTGVNASYDNREAINNNAMYERSDTTHLAVELSKELDNGHTLRSITGYRNWKHEEANDGDVTPLDIIYSEQERDLKIVTQEFQLLSAQNQSWEYLLGAYLFNQSFDENTMLAGGSSLSALGISYGRTFAFSTMELENYALFTHITHHFSDSFNIYAGARALYEKISAEGERYGDPVYGAVFAFPGDLPGGKTEGNDTNGMGTLGLQYFTSSENMFYAKLSRGYKGAAIDTSTDSDLYRGDPDNIALLKPETVTSIELGSKSFFLDRRLSINLGLFMSRFKDFQSSAFDGNKIAFILKNAGEVETRGAELDLASTPWQGALFNLYASYTDGEFAKFKGAPCTVPDKAAGRCNPLTGGQDLSGRPLHDTPEWKYTAVMQQDINLHEGYSAYLRAQYAWRDEVIKSGDLDPNTKADSYGIVSARLGLISPDSWEVNLFIDNALNKDYSTQIFDAPLYEGAYSQYKAPGRTWGVELKAEF